MNYSELDNIRICNYEGMNKVLIQKIKEDLVVYLWHLDITKEKKIVEEISIRDFFKVYFKYPVFQFLLCLRMCNAIKGSRILKPIFLFMRIKFRKLQIKYGIQTGYQLDPQGGFFIGHFGGIVIHQDVEIGKNFTIHQNTTIGTNSRGVPRIGDNVYLGSNVCIIGKVDVGNNCRIGAGSVVTKTIEDDCVVVGNPAHVISKR